MSHLNTFRGSRSVPRKRAKSPETPVPFRSANPDQLQEFTANAELEFSDDGASVLSSLEQSLPSHRMMTMKEYDQRISDLKKENFNLKLRIYFLEEKIQNIAGDGNRVERNANIELKVELASTRTALANKSQLLAQSTQAQERRDEECRQQFDTLKGQHEQECRRLNKLIHDLERQLASSAAESDLALAPARKRRSEEWFRQAFSLADISSETEGAGGVVEDESQMNTLRETLAQLTEQLATANKRVQELEEDAAKKDDYMKSRQKGIALRNQGINGLTEICKAKSRELEEMTFRLHEQSAELGRVKAELANVNDRSLSRDLEIKSCEIKEVKEQLNQLQMLHSEHLRDCGQKERTIVELEESLASLKDSHCVLQRQLVESRQQLERCWQESTTDTGPIPQRLGEGGEAKVASTFTTHVERGQADLLVNEKHSIEGGACTQRMSSSHEPEQVVKLQNELRLALAEIERLRFLIKSTEGRMMAGCNGSKAAGARLAPLIIPSSSSSYSTSAQLTLHRACVSAPTTPIKELECAAALTPVDDERRLLKNLCANLEARAAPCPCVDVACQTSTEKVWQQQLHDWSRFTLGRPSSCDSSSMRRASSSVAELHGGLVELLQVRLEELALFLQQLLSAEADGSMEQSREHWLSKIKSHLKDCELSLSLSQNVYDTSAVSMSETSDHPDALSTRGQFDVTSTESGEATLQSSPLAVIASFDAVQALDTAKHRCRRSLRLDSFDADSTLDAADANSTLDATVTEPTSAVRTALTSYSPASLGGELLVSTNNTMDGLRLSLASTTGTRSAQLARVSTLVSESDSWSEPDRGVSSLRIGLELSEPPPVNRRYRRPRWRHDSLTESSDVPVLTPLEEARRVECDLRERLKLLMQTEELLKINVWLRAQERLYHRHGASAEASAAEQRMSTSDTERLVGATEAVDFALRNWTRERDADDPPEYDCDIYDMKDEVDDLEKDNATLRARVALYRARALIEKEMSDRTDVKCNWPQAFGGHSSSWWKSDRGDPPGSFLYALHQMLRAEPPANGAAAAAGGGGGGGGGGGVDESRTSQLCLGSSDDDSVDELDSGSEAAKRRNGVPGLAPLPSNLYWFFGDSQCVENFRREFLEATMQMEEQTKINVWLRAEERMHRRGALVAAAQLSTRETECLAAATANVEHALRDWSRDRSQEDPSEYRAVIVPMKNKVDDLKSENATLRAQVGVCRARAAWEQEAALAGHRKTTLTSADATTLGDSDSWSELEDRALAQRGVSPVAVIRRSFLKMESELCANASSLRTRRPLSSTINADCRSSNKQDSVRKTPRKRSVVPGSGLRNRSSGRDVAAAPSGLLVAAAEVTSHACSPPRRSRASLAVSSSATVVATATPDSFSKRVFATYEHEISSLRSQLEKSISTYDSLREQFEKRLAESKDKAQLQEEYDCVRAQLEACRSQLKDREADWRSVQAEKDLLYAEIQELTEKFEAYGETIESLRTMLQEKQRASAETNERLDALQALADNSQRQAKEALNERSRAQKHLNDAQDALATAEHQGERLTVELTRLRHELATTDQQLQQARLTLDERQLQLERRGLEVEERDRRLDTVLAEAVTLRARLSELVASNESLTGRLRADKESGQRQSQLVSELRGLHLQLERSVEANRALRTQLDHQLSAESAGATSAASSQDETTSSSFAFSLTRGDAHSPPTEAASADRTEKVVCGVTAVSLDRQLSKSSDYASVSDEGQRQSPHLKSLVTAQQHNQSGSNVALSPDLGIESDRSRFSSLERRASASPAQSGSTPSTPYLKPGMPGNTDWTVVNTAPTKLQAAAQVSAVNVPLNATFAGFQRANAAATSISDEVAGQTCAGQQQSPRPVEERTGEEKGQCYRVTSQDDFRLLRKGIAKGVNVLCAVRECVSRRLSHLQQQQQQPGGDVEEAGGQGVGGELLAWREVTSGCDALKSCLRQCCHLLSRSWPAPLPLNRTAADTTADPSSKQTWPNVESELMRLYFELAKERKRAEEALHKLQVANRLKEKMEKAIVKQLNKTHCVLKKARGNLEHQAKSANAPSTAAMASVAATRHPTNECK